MLDDENFRFDLCQAFTAQDQSTKFQFESFLFKEAEKEPINAANFELKKDQVRYCCEGIQHPKEQFDEIFDAFMTIIDDSGSFEGNNKITNEIKGLKYQKSRMTKRFARKKETCIYSVLKDIQ